MRHGQHKMVQISEEEMSLVGRMAPSLGLRRRLTRKNPRRCDQWLSVY